MFHLPSPLEKLEHSLLDQHRVKLYIKRDDLIHPEVSGNKWRKLKYNIQEMQIQGSTRLLTFGGAFSNHIAATAAAAAYFGMEATGIIRGEELNEYSNPTLQRASELGMKFQFVSRAKYRQLTQSSTTPDFPNHFVIPEGGANKLGIKGVAEIIPEIEIPFDFIICAVGTGTTLAGLIHGLNGRSKALGISVLKGDFIVDEVASILEKVENFNTNYEVETTYHFGGYGKKTQQLIDFNNSISETLSIKLDPIYTGKALFGVWDMIERGKFDDQTLIFLHTGGLQGIAGYNQKNPEKIHY
jgi:1-aminocyclopropane-1-carboxylate deaminase